MFDDNHSKSSFRSLQELIRRSASRQLPADELAKRQERKLQLKLDTFEVGMKLEEAGIPAFDRSQDISIVCAITGEHEKVEQYRNICFLPSIAKKRRAAMLKKLQYFCQLEKNEGKVRMWVFNTGVRAGIAECDDRIRMLNRNVGILASELRDKFAIDIFFRATELGSVQKSKGRTTVHPHAHVLVKTPFVQDWSKAIAWVNARWRQLCDMSPNSTWKPFEESGKLRNVHEACKYVMKPSSLKLLSSEETAELYGALYKKHLVQPLGEFKTLCANIKKNGLRPVRMGNRWQLVQNWNKKTDAETLARECPDDEDAKQRIEEDYWGDELEDRLWHEEDHSGESPANQIISILPPSFYFGNRCAPALLVSKRTDSFLSQGCASSRVVEDLRIAYGEGVGSLLGDPPSFPSPYRVHNRSITSDEPKEAPKDTTLVGADPPI